MQPTKMIDTIASLVATESRRKTHKYLRVLSAVMFHLTLDFSLTPSRHMLLITCIIFVKNSTPQYTVAAETHTHRLAYFI